MLTGLYLVHYIIIMVSYKINIMIATGLAVIAKHFVNGYIQDRGIEKIISTNDIYFSLGID